MKILIVRNDKLGDFVLSLPCFTVIKRALPDAQVTALVPPYTQPIAACFPDIDHVLLDEGSVWALAQQLRAQHFDAVIVLFSTLRIAVATLLAGIPKRLAPQTKLAQFLYAETLTQRRSLSQQPEYQYNLELTYHFLSHFLEQRSVSVSPPFWQLSSPSTVLDEFKQKGLTLIMIHPGSGGSAANLSHHQYATLANNLAAKRDDLCFIISAGKGEEHLANGLFTRINSTHKHQLSGLELVELLHHINGCDVFISGSTGPLHIAGVLNKKTAAFYPNIVSSTSLRWQTLNEAANRLSFSPPAADMGVIDLNEASEQIISKLL